MGSLLLSQKRRPMKFNGDGCPPDSLCGPDVGHTYHCIDRIFEGKKMNELEKKARAWVTDMEEALAPHSIYKYVTPYDAMKRSYESGYREGMKAGQVDIRELSADLAKQKFDEGYESAWKPTEYWKEDASKKYKSILKEIGGITHGNVDSHEDKILMIQVLIKDALNE